MAHAVADYSNYNFWILLVLGVLRMHTAQSAIYHTSTCCLWVSRPGVPEDMEGECKNYSGLCSFTVSFVTMSVGNVNCYPELGTVMLIGNTLICTYIHRGGVTIDTGLWCDVLFLVTWLSGIPLVCKFAYLSDRSAACTRDCRAECPDAVPYQRRHGSGMEANPTEDLHPLVQ